MKSLLIVEDEKLIRQGLRTMVQRSGVPVEMILECGNGEAALEILKEQEIEVMFTDIRMPKMDGIELVHRVAELPQKPLIVAVSGYDDFSYAVEMLRGGVKEYILKPVEREKIQDVLKKLDQEITARKESALAERKIGTRQIRHLINDQIVNEEELALLKQKYEKHFFVDGFVICIFEEGNRPEEGEDLIFIDDVGDGTVCVVDAKMLQPFIKNELMDSNAGISKIHHGVDEIQLAYEEAKGARALAFCRENTVVAGEENSVQIPEGLRAAAEKMLSSQARTQRLQIVGTDKTEELVNSWGKFFGEVRKERIKPEEFMEEMGEFLKELPKIYRNMLLDEDQEILLKCEKILDFVDITSYESYFMDFMLELHNRINRQEDVSKNQQKMKQAVEYIRENYNKDLNMAVVSNYISMNYSLFSYSFKQYTGTNFVSYLKEIRIREAKRLLADTDMKVIDISQTIGYDNEKNFMKIFKGACGVSPSEYRKNMKREGNGNA